MGRKGVSKRKPKKSKSDPKNNNHGSSVQSLVNSKDTPLNRAGANSADPSNKKTRKGK